MTDTPVEHAKAAMQDAAHAAKAQVEQATASAQEMGRAMMEKGMSGMAEFSRLFADMKMPGAGGMEPFLAAQRKNMEVLSAANRVAVEGAQAVAKRHMEIMQQTMAEMTESMRELASPESPQAKAARQAEMLKVTYERAVSHMREIADLIQKSNAEALDMLNHRFAEALDEVKTLAAKGGHITS